jgi:hypothetical protein
MFDPTSRYAPIEVARLTDRDGRKVAYVRRRFSPPGRALPLLVEVTVAQADRLDLITAHTLGDPEHFWRICDANDAMNPFDLTGGDAVGRPLKVPVPQP